MTKPQTTTMSREEKVEQLAFNVWNSDVHSKAYKIAQSKLKNYVLSLLTSRDNEWREKIEKLKVKIDEDTDIGKEMPLNDGLIVAVSYNKALDDLLEQMEGENK